MPLPEPNKKVHKNFKEWLPTCMGNHVMNKEFPDNGQRYKVCQSLWSHKKKKAMYAVETSSDEYIVESDNEYIITPDDEDNNPLSDSPKDDTTPVPPKLSDQWPTNSPQPLDDAHKPHEPGYKNNNVKAENKEPSSQPSGPSGLAPNPDQSNNNPVPSGKNWEKPSLDDCYWFLCHVLEENKNGIPQDYMEPNPDINKLKEYYIAHIDSDLSAEWPLPFDKIEKNFDRPNKLDTPETKLHEKQTKEFKDVNKVDEENRQYSLYPKI